MERTYSTGTSILPSIITVLVLAHTENDAELLGALC